MTLDHYDIRASPGFLDYEFESNGPNGIIKKVVRFSPMNSKGTAYFNLGFGDLDMKTGVINDLSVSNNQDRERILNTVASTVLLFTDQYPDAIIFAKGSNAIRTRLYQIGICSHINEINKHLYVYGSMYGKWQMAKVSEKYQLRRVFGNAQIMN